MKEKRIVAEEFRLADKSGRVRAKIMLDPDGTPIVECFNELGELVSRTDLASGADRQVSRTAPPRQQENIFEYMQRQEREVSETEPKLRVGAHKLFHDFLQNETEASARYVNEVITVTGEIVEVAIREYGDIFVGLKGISGFSPEVICYFTDAQRDKVAKLKVGMKIKLKGKCTEFVSNRVKLWGCLPSA